MKQNNQKIAYIVYSLLSVLSSSIFGQENIYLSPKNNCYDENRDEGSKGKLLSRPIRCLPPFVNAAYEKLPLVNSVCGNPPTSLPCQIIASRQRQQTGEAMPRLRRWRDCNTAPTTCDASDPHHIHPPNHLTDLHNPANLTCWVSAPIPSHHTNSKDTYYKNEVSRKRGLPENIETIKNTDVAITLSLGKKFELTYVSVELCARRVDYSLIIEKSSDNQRTWTPYQFYSPSCRRIFGLNSQSMASRVNEQEVLCSDYAVETFTSGGSALQAGMRLAFSVLEGRPSALEFDTSPVLQDWVTATDIRVVFIPPAKNRFSEMPLYYSVADLSVGGRCKCNGHAQECVTNGEGRFVCRCEHNTMGVDCERCLPAFHDTPWARATATHAHPCNPCSCNRHAKECRFSADLYRMSIEKKVAERSGGVCVRCRHDTTGAHCHICRRGFYRDHNKIPQHRKACIACNCHTVGSLDRTCDHLTGQCRCKEGVVGFACDRCSPGYQQSRSPISPCIKIQLVKNGPIKSKLESLTQGSCPPCKMIKHLKRKFFCKSDYVVELKILERSIEGEWTRFNVEQLHIFKQTTATSSSSKQLSNRYARAEVASNSSKLLDDLIYRVPEYPASSKLLDLYKQQAAATQRRSRITVATAQVVCACPRLALGKTYLVAGTINSTKDEMFVDQNILVRAWKEKWRLKIEQWISEDIGQKCDSF